MIIFLKILIGLFLVAWCGLGVWMVVKYDFVFGQHQNDPHESPGARALSVTQASSIWFGFFVLGVYFLFL